MGQDGPAACYGGHSPPWLTLNALAHLREDDPMELGLDVDDSRPPYTVLAVKGEVDVYTAPRLGVLVGGLKRLRSHDGELSLVCTHQRVMKVFEITGLTKVFSIYGSVDDAVAG